MPGKNLVTPAWNIFTDPSSVVALVFIFCLLLSALCFNQTRSVFDAEVRPPQTLNTTVGAKNGNALFLLIMFVVILYRK